MKKIGIIGCGKLGSNLGIQLSKKGFEVSFESRNIESSKKVAKIANSNNFTSSIGKFSKYADIVFITVTDDKIEEVVKKIAFNEKTILFHCSGVLSSKILNVPLAGSFHPIQSFSKIEKDNPFKNIVIGIESGNKKVFNIGVNIAKELCSTPFFIESENKVLYHASCCIASNYLVTLIHSAFSLLKKSKIKKDIYFKILMPLIYKTIENIEKVGFEKALTGPISRGDTNTIQKHVEEIEKKMPKLLDLYKELGLKTVEVLSFEKKDELETILKK